MNKMVALGMGLLAGYGIDEILRRLSIIYPQLQQPSGVPMPGYDPRGIHFDDLLALGSGGAMVGAGLYKKVPELSYAGAGVMAGSYIASVTYVPFP